jgi:hypothetical protein
MTSWQTQKGYALLGKLAGIEADGRVKVKMHKPLVRQLPPIDRDHFRRRVEDELQQARKFVERVVSERQKKRFAKGCVNLRRSWTR